MRVTFLGTGHAFFGAGRGHSAVLIEDSSGRMLVECGATAPLALRKMGLSPSRLDAIAVTHFHGDHLAGLPFVLLGAEEEPFAGPLQLVGPPGLERRVEALVSTLYPDSRGGWRAALSFQELAPGQAATLGGRRLIPLRADHMGGEFIALGYRLESDGRVLAFSGDTGPLAPLEELAKGADLFVCECTLAAADPGAQHLTPRDIAERAPRWRTKRILLTHLSAETRERARAIPGVEVADDGLIIDLGS